MNKNIIGYTIVEHKLGRENDLIIFTMDVKKAVDQGWQPLGGPVIDPGNGIIQAMVLYGEPVSNDCISHVRSIHATPGLGAISRARR